MEGYLMEQHGSAYCLQRFRTKVQAFKTKRDHEFLVKYSSISITILFKSILAQKRDAGAVWSWGYGRNGQLGHGGREDSIQPRLVKHFQNNQIAMVSAADSHSVAVDEQGVIYQWGDGLVTVTPRGEEELTLLPGVVNGEAIERLSKLGGKVVKISAGECHAAVLTEGGLLFTWGLGLRGCLGHSDEFNRKAPCSVPDFEDADNRVVDVSAGPMSTGEMMRINKCCRHFLLYPLCIPYSLCILYSLPYCTAVVTIHGEVMLWGCGMHGKLGNGGTEGRLKPGILADLRAEVKDEHSKLYGKECVHVSISKYHGVCVMDGGEVRLTYTSTTYS
jgi:alpha-tubulin suppressor-like RCC1 family protein